MKHLIRSEKSVFRSRSEILASNAFQPRMTIDPLHWSQHWQD